MKVLKEKSQASAKLLCVLAPLIAAFASSLAFAADSSLPPLTGKSSAQVGDCALNVAETFTRGARRNLRLRIEDPKSGDHAKFTFDLETGMPSEGFNSCNSGTRHGPVKVITETAGDLKRIRYQCGSAWNFLEGEAEIVLNRKTRMVESVKLNLDSAHYNPMLFAGIGLPEFLSHTGPLKTNMAKVDCRNKNYSDEPFVLHNAVHAANAINGAVAPRSIEYGMVNRFEYRRAQDVRALDAMLDQAWDKRDSSAGSGR